MGNCLRCCIACVLPCGALDVVRVLHVDGSIDEYRQRITAGEVMKANPKHVLAQPIGEALVKKPSFLHPDAELRKGKIYFLVPAYTLQKESKAKPKSMQLSSSKRSRADESNGTPKECTLRPQLQCERPSNWLGQQRMISRRGSNNWKPVLESISEVDDTLLRAS